MRQSDRQTRLLQEYTEEMAEDVCKDLRQWLEQPLGLLSGSFKKGKKRSRCVNYRQTAFIPDKGAHSSVGLVKSLNPFRLSVLLSLYHVFLLEDVVEALIHA